MAYDAYGRFQTNDQGVAQPSAGPAAGLQPVIPFVIKVPYTAGAGTTLDIQVTAPQKLRVIDAYAITTTTVTSAVMQVFTASGGGGTAVTSSLATAAAGLTRNALTTATTTFAAGATIFCRQSGGATLAGGELYLLCLPEA